MAIKRLFLVPLLVICFQGFSQTRNVAAVKTTTPPKIDGDLGDAAWATAPIASDFIQNFPKPGEPATVRSEIKILYDNSAIYIGAMLYDDPSLIRKQLTARDGEQRTDVDYFSVFFDTYNDNQNGFQFLVTSANVQTDARLSANFVGDLVIMVIRHGTPFGKVKRKCLIRDGQLKCVSHITHCDFQKKTYRIGAFSSCVSQEEIMKTLSGILLTLM